MEEDRCRRSHSGRGRLGGRPSPRSVGGNVAGGTAQGQDDLAVGHFIEAPKERAALNRVAQQWARKTGNKVVNPGDVSESMDKFRLTARTGRGPDVIQFPHDNLGRMAASGVLAAQPKGFVVSRGLYDKVGLTATTVQGRALRAPIARESYFLFYNRSLVRPPEDLDGADRHRQAADER